MAGFQTVMAVLVIIGSWLAFLVSVSAAALMIQRRYYTSNWQNLRRRFPASVQREGRD